MESRRDSYSDSKSNQRKKPHMLLLSYPLQGHITPLMKLAHRLADNGTKVTLVISEFIHSRIVSGFIHPPKPSALGEEQHPVRLLPVPDGLEPGDDRKDESKLAESITKVMPGHLEELIKKANYQSDGDDHEKITCVISDVAFTWATEIAEKMRLKHVMFFPSAPGILAMILRVPKLIESGVVDTEGSPTRDEKIELSPNLPDVRAAEFVWNCPGNLSMQKLTFEYILSIHQNVKLSAWVLCNWFHELDPSINDLVPNMLSIGPLLANGQHTGNFLSEDLTCLNWLDRQNPGSVIYIAFGTTSVFDQKQLDELALGLELVGRPFLWVVRSDLTKGFPTSYPDGFTERTADLGKIIQWAPQEKVLAHPSVACYLTHCGWNSTIEGLTMGVPLLCWPYLADQFYNRSCICEGWKVGLWLSPDEDGIITRYEIKKKIDELLCKDGIKANSQKLQELAQKSVGEGGSSSKNLRDFIEKMNC